MFLISPQPQYIKSYIGFCIDFKKNSLADFFLNSFSATDLEKNPAERIAPALLDELDKNARAGKIPCPQYWLIDNDEVVGVGNIRHYLTPALEFFGGHVGYGVKLGRWGEGCGTVLLRELLGQMPALGIKTALLTCDAANAPSMRVMEKNGATLLDTLMHEMNGVERTAHRFLIDTGLALDTAAPVKNHAMLYQVETGGELALIPFKAVDEGGRIVSYYFNILRQSLNVGWIVFRVGAEPWLYYDGNIGYFIKQKHRGSGYAEAACRLIGAKLKRLGVTRTFITCDSDNAPSRRICQNLGAVFLEIARQRPGAKVKCRYLWRL